MIDVTLNPIDPQKAISKVRDKSCGAVVAFVGSVRDLSGSKEVLFLEYDPSAGELARRELQGIADEIRAKWPIENVAICHRLGRLDVGEITTVFAVAAPHRKEAFQACQHAIDRFKEVVVLWEKEVTVGDEPDRASEA
ncbi:MAG: molybdenum cofactor biosynthesis protein MoaE [Chloroflexi bacterium]|nr:MAG: molybdenum cofactor biosynthesis protein MoaE [Chloroflexota bacterium]RLC96808.1 MAG: molybdenum cofactor biosynthesis protein MoaE [Chloroflexota bacterium]